MGRGRPVEIGGKMKTFEISLHAIELGGGLKLALYREGVENGGGVFPAGVRGYCDALDEGESWLIAV